MTTENLKAALGSVDWNQNVAAFASDASLVSRLAVSNMRIAIWASQFENCDADNPALSYVREMQVSSQQLAAQIALALYRSAAASMRNILEAALYYSFFRSHPVELETLTRDIKFFVDKGDILDFHRLHTPRFVELQTKVDLVARLDAWYRKVSAILHGQIPGTWQEHMALKDVRHIPITLNAVVETFQEGEEIVHRLFLCTAGRTLWDGFSSGAKRELLRGHSGDMKTLFGLETA